MRSYIHSYAVEPKESAGDMSLKRPQIKREEGGELSGNRAEPIESAILRSFETMKDCGVSRSEESHPGAETLQWSSTALSMKRDKGSMMTKHCVQNHG